MCKSEAKAISDLYHDLIAELGTTKNDQDVILGWIRTIEPEYIKAQKTLAKYNK